MEKFMKKCFCGSDNVSYTNRSLDVALAITTLLANI